MKVLVTGAGGFIGGYVQEELIARGHTPIAFDRHDKGFRPDGSEFYLGDITDSNAVTEAVAHSDAFIHLAGVLGTQETIKNPGPAVHTNIAGALNLFNAAVQYDVWGVNIAVGNHWMNNTYAITKSTVERFVMMYNKELKAHIQTVRALNAYGPRQVSAAPYGPSKVKKIMPAFINAALHDKPIEIYGDGTQVMDMIYVADVAQILVAVMEETVEKGVNGSHIYEAGSGNDTTVNEIAGAVLREVYGADHFNNPEGGTEVDFIKYLPMRPGEPKQSIVLGDPNTLRDLRLREFTSLGEGVKRTVEYYRNA